MVYRNLSEYMREHYGTKVMKVCIDGGFTCPNRDGKCGTGGCIYCNERGAGEHLDHADMSVRAQVKRFFERPGKAEKFIAYFQNFTNTYAPIAELKQKYDDALTDPRIIGLSVGTRPDCIDEEVAALLASYKKRGDVWVELGLQTSSDQTADLINRGYHRDAFENAMRLLTQYGLDVVVHIIIGLPGEGMAQIAETVEYLNRFPLFGLKIHCIYVMEGTKLAEMTREGLYTPPTMREYADAAIYVLTHISPDVVIHRLTGNCQKERLVAPNWNLQKDDILYAITSEMEKNHWYQGIFYQKAK